MTWEEICAEPVLANLPYRIETDKWGNILMSPPPGIDHSYQQSRINILLDRLMKGGYSLTECPVQTPGGVRAMDAAWMSQERFEQGSQGKNVYQIAPEICVEVRSPRNSFAEIQEKMSLYFSVSAVECWVCDRGGRMSFFDAEGPIPRSELCPDFPDIIR